MKRILLLLLLGALMQNTAWVSAQEKQFTLDDFITNYTFYPSSVYGLRSMNDGEHYTIFDRRSNTILRYSYRTGELMDTLLNMNNLKIPRVVEYEFSDNEERLLLQTEREDLYRRSFYANYYVYDLKTKTIAPLYEKGKQRLATFSPNADKVAFVYDNNLFYKDLATNEIIQITQDGKWNEIINGAPDWVYEEEFGYNQAFDWSPDGKYLAWCRFDESQVPEFSMTLFKGMAPELEDNRLYPEVRTWKYPKAGDANSVVSAHIFDLKKQDATQVNVGQETDQYIPRIKWNPKSELIVYRLNRLQNKLDLMLANPKNGKTSLLYSETNKYYVDEKFFDLIDFMPNGKEFIMLSEKGGYAQLFLFDNKGKEVINLTPGQYDVTDYIGYDSENETIYYTSAEKSPLMRHVYSVKIDGSNKKLLTDKDGSNRAVFSSGFKYFINYHSSITSPTLVSLHDASGGELRILEDNSELKSRLEEYAYSNKEMFTFKTSENVELNGWILKPVDFDPNKEYPVLMTQYSGPNSQQVLNRWEFGWEQLLAQDGYIVACVDGRGTGARGEEFRKMTYLQLGKYETIDQIETAKYLASQPYVDGDRIGIWGWSYGGFMTLLAMEKGNGIFKAGMSVAPVTNWRYYDNIYTERFMRTPHENPNGYDENSPITHAGKLQGKLLIVHGSADDNVHLQNTMEYTEALVQHGKDFEMMIYTNRNHGIYGGNTRKHLYKKMYNFVKSNI